MISSLLPGFAGSPADRWARAERAADRRPVEPDRDTIVGDASGEGAVRGDPWRRLEEHPAVEEVRDGAAVPSSAVEGERDPRIRRRYTEREIAEMESIRSARYPGDDPEHHHGVHPWDGLATTAPVMGNPSLDPANGDLVAVSYMAGYGGEAAIGHDAMSGVDSMVLGHVDATRELDVESATEGPPLRLAHDESVYSDDRMLGTHDLRIGAREAGDGQDWCAELRLWAHEPEARGWL